jgi:integrase
MITKRSNGYYYFIYGSNEKGNRVRKSLKTTNKKIAEKLGAALYTEIMLQENGIATSSLNVAELYKEYYNLEILPKKTKAWADRVKIVMNHLIEYMGTKQIKNVRLIDINKYINNRLSVVAGTTVKKELSIIKKMFEYAHNNTYISSNPTIAATIGDVKSKDGENIPKDVWEKLMRLNIPRRDRIFWNILYYTGLRAVDAGTLKKEDVENGVVNQKKTDRDVGIYLHPKLIEYGNEIYEIYIHKGDRDKSRELLQKKLEGMGYPLKKWNLHSLRHSFTTNLQELGLGLEDIKNLTGHSTSKMASKYAHGGLKLQKQYIDKLV